MSYDILSKDKLEYTLGKIKEKIDAGGGGTTVIPNPEGEATENLEKIKIGNDIYKVEGSEGTTVIPNPEDEATDTLQKIKIGEDTYKIEGSSGANTDIIAKEWNNTDTYSKDDYVVYDEKLWKSILDNNSGNTPSDSSLYWIATDVGIALSDKQDKLIAGDNIIIEDNVVSADIDEYAINYSLDDTGNGLTIEGGFVPKGHTYSTEEKIVGTWIDGKPIYERTVSITIDVPNQNTILYFTGDYIADNIEYITIIKSFINHSVSYGSSGHINHANKRTQFYTENGFIRASSDRTIDTGVWYIVVQYTKTTD